MMKTPPLLQSFIQNLVAQGVLGATDIVELRVQARETSKDVAALVWERVKSDPDLLRRFEDALQASGVRVLRSTVPDPEGYQVLSPEGWERVLAAPVKIGTESWVATPHPFSPEIRELAERYGFDGIAFAPAALVTGVLAELAPEGGEDAYADVFPLPEIGLPEEGEPTRVEMVFDALADMIPAAELGDEEGNPPERVLQKHPPEVQREAMERLFETWRVKPEYGEVLEYREDLTGIAPERPGNPDYYVDLGVLPVRLPGGRPAYLTYLAFAGKHLEEQEAELEPRPFALVPPHVWDVLARRIRSGASGKRAESIAEILREEGLNVSEALLAECRSLGDEECAERLAEEGVADENDLARALARKYGMRHVDLSTSPPDETLLSAFDPALLRRLKALPLSYEEASKTLYVAIAHPKVDLSPLIERAPKEYPVQSVIPAVAVPRRLLRLLPPVPLERSPLMEFLRELETREVQRAYLFFRGAKVRLRVIPEGSYEDNPPSSLARDLEAELQRLVGSGQKWLPDGNGYYLVAGEVRRRGRPEFWAVAYLRPGVLPLASFHQAFEHALQSPGVYRISGPDPKALRAFLLERASEGHGSILWIAEQPPEHEAVVAADPDSATRLFHFPATWAVVELTEQALLSRLQGAPYPIFVIAPVPSQVYQITPTRPSSEGVVG